MKSKRGRYRSIVILLYSFIAILAATFFGSKAVFASDDHLTINEVYPNPLEVTEDEVLAKEWIELFNPTDLDIDLSNYLLKDKANHTFSKLTGLILKSGEYLIVTDENILNNTGDSIFLKNNENTIDQVIYGNTNNYPLNAKLPAIGKSITRIVDALDTDVDNVDFIVATPTPGAEYAEIIEIVKEKTSDVLNINDARALENGEDVTVTGVVTTLPGALSSQYFYIQDGTGGIQIYCYGKTFPTLTLGDLISVTGELSQTNNERRIKISGAEKIVILNHTEPVVPEEIAISEIGEEAEGTYIKTAGIVTETSGDTFHISDGQSEIKVVINKSTKIDKPKMKKGDQVEVAGIVSQYKDEYRILPIDQDDVRIVASKDQLPRSGI